MELKERAHYSISLLQKAIMQLTGYGANNTTYLKEVSDLIKDQRARINELEAEKIERNKAINFQAEIVQSLQRTVDELRGK